MTAWDFNYFTLILWVSLYFSLERAGLDLEFQDRQQQCLLALISPVSQQLEKTQVTLQVSLRTMRTVMRFHYPPNARAAGSAVVTWGSLQLSEGSKWGWAPFSSETPRMSGCELLTSGGTCMSCSGQSSRTSEAWHCPPLQLPECSTVFGYLPWVCCPLWWI